MSVYADVMMVGHDESPAMLACCPRAVQPAGDDAGADCSTDPPGAGWLQPGSTVSLLGGWSCGGSLAVRGPGSGELGGDTPVSSVSVVRGLTAGMVMWTPSGGVWSVLAVLSRAAGARRVAVATAPA